MNTKFIEIVFTEYLNKSDTQYAVLINGPWGSGKTYFWKNNLVKIAKQQNFESLYLSLNGISKVEEIDHQLFIKLLPTIGKKERQVYKDTVSVLYNIVNGVTKRFTSLGLSEIFKGVGLDSFDFSNYVICFDDLERCQIPINELIGFINNYVEHKHLKTIVLADEPKVAKDEDYDIIKEKVIGRILNFELSPSNILSNLFLRYEIKNESFFKFLTKYQSFINNVFLDYKLNNLRVIAFYLDILETVYPLIDNQQEKYIFEVLLFISLISIEFKKGNLKSSDTENKIALQQIEDGYYNYNLRNKLNKNQQQAEKEEKTFQEFFYEKYLTGRIDQYYFYPSIYDYILTGYFDADKFAKELKSRYPVPQSDHIQSFQTLLNYNFRELSDDSFNTNFEKVLKYSIEGKYEIYVYAQIAEFLYFFSANGLIQLSAAEIKKIINKGLEIAKERKLINDSVLENLLHFKSENPKVEEIKKEIRDAHSEIRKQEYINESEQLILSFTDENLMGEVFKKYSYSNKLFPYINNSALYNAIIIASNKLIFKFTELMINRYKSNGLINEMLFTDYDCLFSLNQSLSSFIKNESLKQPRKFLFETLIKELENICNNLNLVNDRNNKC